jgi:hypothetical protein
MKNVGIFLPFEYFRVIWYTLCPFCVFYGKFVHCDIACSLTLHDFFERRGGGKKSFSKT